MNKQYYSLIFLTAACLLLSLLYCPPVDLLGVDKEVFRYGGMVIGRGGVPYRDFFDHKPPLIFFLNTISFFGGQWTFWFIDFTLVLLVTLVFFRLCQRYRLPCPWLLPLLFNLMIRDFLLRVGIGMTREYAAIFELIFFCIAIGTTRYKYFCMGLLGGLVFFMQQEQSLALLPILVYVLLTDRPVFSGILRLGAGFLTITLPLLLFFAAHRALDLLWQDAFLFNFKWYTAQKESLGDHFRTIKQMLDALNYELPFMIAITLGLSSLLFKHKKKGLLLAALLTVLLSLSQEFMGRREEIHPFEHYFIPLSASICFLLFVVFAFTEETALLDRRMRPVYAVLLCASLTYTAFQHATHLRRAAEEPDYLSPAYIYLQRKSIGDYQIYPIRYEYMLHVLNEKKMLSPSPWIYQHFWTWYPKWDPGQQLLKGIGDDLLRHRTTYIAMDSTAVAAFINPANSRWWFSFINEHYNRVPLPGPATSISIWERKDRP